VKGSALRVVRKAVVPRQDASAAVVQEEVAPPESQETPAKDAAVEFNTTEEFGIEAGEPEAVKAAPVFCELCETQLLEWSRTQMRCPKCRRNFPRAA
jgi:hypothetical protein